MCKHATAEDKYMRNKTKSENILLVCIGMEIEWKSKEENYSRSILYQAIKKSFKNSSYVVSTASVDRSKLFMEL